MFSCANFHFSQNCHASKSAAVRHTTNFLAKNNTVVLFTIFLTVDKFTSAVAHCGIFLRTITQQYPYIIQHKNRKCRYALSYVVFLRKFSQHCHVHKCSSTLHFSVRLQHYFYNICDCKIVVLHETATL